MSRHTRHMERAASVAALSTQRQKHGAVIAKGNRVLAVGVNRYRNHPSVCSNPKIEAATHAEIAAMAALPPDTDFSRLTMYVARVDSCNVPKLSKPCARCTAEISRRGFKEVLWTL